MINRNAERKCKILNSFRKYKKGQQIEEKYYILENLLVASIEDVYSCPDTWYFKSPCPKFCKAVTIFLVIFFFFQFSQKKNKKYDTRVLQREVHLDS